MNTRKIYILKVVFEIQIIKILKTWKISENAY